jgi:hypothetical protein
LALGIKPASVAPGATRPHHANYCAGAFVEGAFVEVMSGAFVEGVEGADDESDGFWQPVSNPMERHPSATTR